MNANRQKRINEGVLREMCKMTFNFFGYEVFSATTIAYNTGLTKYKALKALHELRDDGLVERASQGNPAQVSYGEVVELICDAAPPTNSWSLTEKARESEIYKAEAEEFDRSMEEWVNGLCKEGK